MNNTVFIPARKNSKGIPGKAWKELNGKPLISYAIEAAINCESINSICVNTDSKEVKGIAKQYPGVWLYDRKSEKDFDDETDLDSVIFDFANIYDFDYLLLIQPTNPFTTSEDLTRALNLVDKSSSLLSVVKQKRFLWDEVKEIPINYNPIFRANRQEINNFHYVENGAFYITSKESLLRNHCRLDLNDILYYSMSQRSYFELDEPEDWAIVESIMKGQVIQGLNKEIKKESEK